MCRYVLTHFPRHNNRMVQHNMEYSCVQILINAAVMCPVLIDPTNGMIMYTEIPSGSLGFMEMATYSCNAGFGLSGGDPVRTCEGAAGSSGDWTETAPTCEGRL